MKLAKQRQQQSQVYLEVPYINSKTDNLRELKGIIINAFNEVLEWKDWENS